MLLLRRHSLIGTAALAVPLAALSLVAQQSSAQERPGAATVALEQSNGSWVMTRGGAPYRIRGAGGDGPLAKLAAFGGNSTRTWGIDQLEDGRLDDAHRHGLAVSVGIWLRHDLDYSDESQVAEQVDRALAAVRRYKNHPAVLVWGIGNEMEGDGSRTEVWEHVEHLAAMIKVEDPHHPTMTVLAEIGGEKIGNLHRHCPSIDIVGINAYGGAASIPSRYREAGGTKPYLLAEFGPRGPWDHQRNDLGTFDEELGKVKADTYLESYRTVDSDTELCLGSYAFMWGHKQEATPTWFGMFLADGSRTPALDAMSFAWTGAYPENRCPEIGSLALAGAADVSAGSTVTANLSVADPEDDELEIQWVMMEDAPRHLTAGYFQATPPSFENNILEGAEDKATFRAPDKPGLYRIFAYARDDAGGADAANVVFRVTE